MTVHLESPWNVVNNSLVLGGKNQYLSHLYHELSLYFKNLSLKEELRETELLRKMPAMSGAFPLSPPNFCYNMGKIGFYKIVLCHVPTTYKKGGEGRGYQIEDAKRYIDLFCNNPPGPAVAIWFPNLT